MFNWLLRNSAELTGITILLYNYQPYDRQQQILGAYNSCCNAARALTLYYYINSQLSILSATLPSDPNYPQQLTKLCSQTLKLTKQLCVNNGGLFYRMTQVISNMRGVIPEVYRQQLSQINNKTLVYGDYEQIKSLLVENLKKPMKDIFDGFQNKPLEVTALWQTHKCILLQNYRESVTKIVLPRIKYQTYYDKLILNKFLEFVRQSVQKSHPQAIQSFQQTQKIMREAEAVAQQEINLQKQMENADKLNPLMYQANSSFYIPYYYKKYATQNTLVREYIQAISLQNSKALKELGLTSELAYAHIMAALHKIMTKYNFLNTDLNPTNLLIRKYIKPAPRIEPDQPTHQSQAKKQRRGIGAKDILHPPYQVVVLSLNNLQQIPGNTQKQIEQYWTDLKKKTKIKQLPSVRHFYEGITGRVNLKASQLMQKKYYLYEPLLEMYQKFVSPNAQPTKTN